MEKFRGKKVCINKLHSHSSQLYSLQEINEKLKYVSYNYDVTNNKNKNQEVTQSK